MSRSRAARRLAAVAVTALALAGCGDSATVDEPERTPAPAEAGEARFPTIEDVQVSQAGPGVYDFAVTISSPYDSPERYANGWRVLAPDGTVLGEQELAHDHASEQPFTREQTGVRIPSGTDSVRVEPRDLRNGYGGEKVEASLP